VKVPLTARALPSTIVPPYAVPPEPVEKFVIAPAKLVSTVEVPVPELLSKITLSAEPGTTAPPGPPEEVDQLDATDQLPVPPTQ